MRSLYAIRATIAEHVHNVADTLNGGPVSCPVCYDMIEAGIADELHDTYGDPMDPYGDLRHAAWPDADEMLMDASALIGGVRIA